ncbi:uncharacterized protein FIBRA_06657 [Fibroporia radiculosa]|uniref:Uncharacterized protein n=1 Tax=Fibroporia radiculosa TaxID=599839 RepID=J4HZG3_9APHY|nr:uncharacterized protein FIBRA_06657 [Fibroporia radiculosa]CCM04477.1 predicted protein [Fibroporia radiculosa]
MADTVNATISAAQLVYYTNSIDGPALAGSFMNIMLYGVMITQIFFYYTTYTNDTIWSKYYVGVLFLADTLNSFFNIWWIYNTLINNFGNSHAILYAD